MTIGNSVKVVGYGEILLSLGNEYLKFNTEDQQTSERIFREPNTRLLFVLEISNSQIQQSSASFYIYLGKDPYEWDDDYAIELQKIPLRDLWQACSEDRNRIKQQYWCAATAKITLCNENKKPLLTEDGKLVQTTIGLGFDGWYDAVYQSVRSGLEQLNQQINITTPFEQLLAISREAALDSSDSDALILYLRIKNLLPTFTACVDAIIKSPAQKMIGQVQNFSTLSVSSHSYGLNVNYSFSSVVSIQKTRLFNRKMLPLAFSYLEAKSSYDIEENFLAYWCIEKVKKALEFVKEELASLIESLLESANRNSGIHKAHLEKDAKKHKTELDKIDGFIYFCQKSLSALPLSSKPDSVAHVHNFSELINYDWRYSKLWQLANLIQDAVNFTDTSSEKMPFQVASFQDNYEKWCLIQVCQALKDIGFKLIKRGELMPFYKKPKPNSLFCELSHPQHAKQHVKVFYERKYEPVSPQSEKDAFGFWEPIKNDLARNDWKKTPDIALEFYDDDRLYPLIITFDPTLGGHEICRKKYLYKETIRLNDLSPDGLNIVIAAWAIAPGTNPQEGERYTRMHESRKFSQGTITLNHLPDSQKELSKTISKILQKNRLLDDHSD